MAIFDLPLEQLKAYRSPDPVPADFDAFWAATLAEARTHALDAQWLPQDTGLKALDVFDASFAGFGGQRVKAWLVLPKERKAKLPCVVDFIGYGGGRSFATDWLLWAGLGYANLVMDTRGQGSDWSTGDTPDPEPEGSNPHQPGFMTRGVLDPKTYYYRRVFTDGVRAVEAAQSHAAIDPQRLAVNGASQGGGISIAVAGLCPSVKAVMPDVPFLCHYRRATEISDAFPYREIPKYLKVHRNSVEQVFKTLSYFDGVNFAARSRSQALYSVALMDMVCPPSTVFAAYNEHLGPKAIKVWQFNEHEGGGPFQVQEKIKLLKGLWPDI